MSIGANFRQLALDEGSTFALDTLQGIQLTLETLIEAGDEQERQAAGMLLERVNSAIKESLVGDLTPDMIEWSWQT